MSVYVSETDYYVSSETLSSLQSELRKLGEGVSRRVYDLGDRTVLKVCHSPNSFAGNNLSEWNSWQTVKDTEYASSFAECIAIAPDGRWMVQRAIDQTFDSLGYDRWREWWQEEGKEIEARFGISDLHPGNVGLDFNGNVVICDYAMNEERGNAESFCQCEECIPQSTPYSSPCGCGSCDCEDCKPEGCDCEELEGCNEKECEICAPIRNFVWIGARHYVLSVAVCSAHYVPRIAWSLRARNAQLERQGQGNLFGGFRIRSIDPD